MADRVLAQCELFNQGVRTGDWTGYVAAFAPDGTLRIEGDPGSPYPGREAIAAAYADAPPDDTITVLSVDSTPDTDTARFAWGKGGGGTLHLHWTDTGIKTLTVHFDEP